MIELKPDSNIVKESKNVKVFLAGSIEMGTIEKWQEKVTEKFKDLPVTFYNPRRDDWDSSWKQDQRESNFNFQVNWELNHLEESDIIYMNFVPDTKSPISLLELGLFAVSKKIIVCCPEDFWRKGNVEIVCTRYSIPFYESFDKSLGA